MKCKKCGKKLDPLEVFSGQLCVDCYEKEYDKRLKKTGKLPKPDFVGTIKWR